MGNNNYFDELIVSYLLNELDQEEESFVSDWIHSSEANKQYFEELKSALHLLLLRQTVKNMDITTEWAQFKTFKSTFDKQLEINNPGSGNSEFIACEKRGRKSKVYKLLASIGVAASFFLAIGLVWKLTYTNETINKSVSVIPFKDVTRELFSERIHFNTTDKTQVLNLEDGSEVHLFAKSKISYVPFSGTRRDLTLIGKAKFTVAKDKAKPFTVFSGDLATTALGTQFTVTSFENGSNITVRLYEGKVVVRSFNSSIKKPEKDYYLLAGQELIYNKAKWSVTIGFFKEGRAPGNKNRKEQANAYDNPSVPVLGKETWYMFNNQPLDQVLDQLEGMFETDIIYSKKDLSSIYVIGTFNKTDKLDYILAQLSRLNKLKLVKKNGSYIIKR